MKEIGPIGIIIFGFISNKIWILYIETTVVPRTKINLKMKTIIYLLLECPYNMVFDLRWFSSIPLQKKCSIAKVSTLFWGRGNIFSPSYKLEADVTNARRRRTSAKNRFVGTKGTCGGRTTNCHTPSTNEPSPSPVHQVDEPSSTLVHSTNKPPSTLNTHRHSSVDFQACILIALSIAFFDSDGDCCSICGPSHRPPFITGMLFALLLHL